MTPEAIMALAHKHGWRLITQQQPNRMISFKKKDVRVNVYYTKMTVGTCLKHPTKGKTQLFRKNISIKGMEEIFKNPRTHTGIGYYVKEEDR
jgi:hypothetical protein